MILVFRKVHFLPWRLKFGHLGASGYQIYFSVYRVDHGKFEIKTFPIFPPPHCTCIPDLRCMDTVACAGCCGGGHISISPAIPKWGIMFVHSLHHERLAAKSTGGVQGPALGPLVGSSDIGRGPGGVAPWKSWISTLQKSKKTCFGG